MANSIVIHGTLMFSALLLSECPEEEPPTDCADPSCETPAPLGEGIGLTVDNPLEHDRNAQWVTTGIPIPERWALTQTGALSIADANGDRLPVQVDVATRRGGPADDATLPISWAHVTFPASVAAGSSAQYTLVHDGGDAPVAGITWLEDSSQQLVLDTGKARFTVSRTRFNLFEAVEMDGVSLVAPDKGGLRAVAVGGREYLSSGAPTVTVESPGPLKARIRVEGALMASTGESLLDYRAWVHFQAGSALVVIDLTVGNHRKAVYNSSQTRYEVFDYGGQNSVSFESLSLRIGMASSPTVWQVPSGLQGSLAGTERLDIYQDSSGTDYWNRYQGTAQAPRVGSSVRQRGYNITRGSMALETGNRFGGWLAQGDGQRGLAVGVRDLWQNYPKGISSQGGVTEVGLFPEAFSSAFNFRVGEEKTHTLAVAFGTTTAPAALGQQVGDELAPMMARAEPSWYAQYGGLPMVAMPDTLEGRLGSSKATDDRLRYDYYNDRTLIFDQLDTTPPYRPFHSLALSLPGHPSSVDYFDFYGWSWYGNTPLEEESVGDGKAGPFDTKYDFDYGSWIQYLRGGDARWRVLAEAQSRHSEQLMLHDVITDTGWDIYRWKNAIFGHSQHNESGYPNSVRNYLGPVADTAFGSRGSALNWLLTAYPPSRRFVEKGADYAYDFYQDISYSNDPIFVPNRPSSNVFNLLNEGFRITGDVRYLEFGAELLMDWAPEKHDWIQGPIPGSTVVLPSWCFSLFYGALARYSELAEEAGMLEEAALARAQLITWLNWHLANACKDPQGWLTTYYNYRVDGNNDASSTDMITNWALPLADAFAWGYRFSGDPRFHDAAERLFHTGAQNPYFLGSPLMFSSGKEAVNHASFGQVSLELAAE